MNIWVFSDPHFGDSQSLRFRGFPSEKEMDKTILNNCRRLIKKEDLTYILGDLGKGEAALKKCASIAGSKRIVLGNHDEKPLELYKKYFPHTQFRSWFRMSGVILSHFPLHPQELEYEPLAEGHSPARFNVHGHVHLKSIPDYRYYNACVENNNWGPVLLSDIFKDWGLSL
tara:strand:- start:22852 stop:23364 length:513 start_codon:yes stop_codon:yes gene_type:complete